MNPTHRINVIGASGSGASTVGRSLAVALSVGYFDCDDYFHVPTDPPFQRQRTAAERHAAIMADLLTDESWVLGGGVAGWDPYPELQFTCIVFLYVPTSIRIPRLRERERLRFGDRIESGGDMNKTHEEFIAWASRYDVGDVEGKTLARHEAYLDTQTCPVVKLRGDDPLASLTADVLGAIGSP